MKKQKYLVLKVSKDVNKEMNRKRKQKEFKESGNKRYWLKMKEKVEK